MRDFTSDPSFPFVSSPSAMRSHDERGWPKRPLSRSTDRWGRAQTTNRHHHPDQLGPSVLPHPATRLPARRASLLTKYQCYHPRDYVFRAGVGRCTLAGSALRADCSREPSGGDREPSCLAWWCDQRVSRRGGGGGGRLAKGVVAERPGVMMFV